MLFDFFLCLLNVLFHHSSKLWFFTILSNILHVEIYTTMSNVHYSSENVSNNVGLHYAVLFFNLGGEIPLNWCAERLKQITLLGFKILLFRFSVQNRIIEDSRKVLFQKLSRCLRIILFQLNNSFSFKICWYACFCVESGIHVQSFSNSFYRTFCSAVNSKVSITSSWLENLVDNSLTYLVLDSSMKTSIKEPSTPLFFLIFIIFW